MPWATVTEQGEPKSWVGAADPVSVEWRLVSIYHNAAWAEANLRTKWHLDSSNHLATIGLHQRYRQTAGQRSHSIGRTVTCNGRPENDVSLNHIILQRFFLVINPGAVVDEDPAVQSTCDTCGNCADPVNLSGWYGPAATLTI